MSSIPTHPRTSVLLIGVLLACGCCASGGSQLRTVTTDQGADARVLFRHDSFELSASGVRTHTVHEKATIFTEVAIDELGDPRVAHDAANGSLKVLKAETTMRDGTVVAIKPNSINETTPDALARAPAYADWRETVITHVGMEVGCTNELEYRIEQKPSKSPLTASVPVHLSFPIDERQVRVRVPAGTELRWACLGCEVEPTRAEKEGGVEQIFTWKGLPRLNLEEGHGQVINQPRLVFTTVPSWKALGASIGESFAAAAAVTGPVSARAEELTERLATEEQQLGALWRFVADELATVDWPLAAFELRPRPAAKVLESSYGHSLDKAVLLAALLGGVKIQARPLLVSRDGLFAAAAPAAPQFSEVWLAVEVEGQTRWIDPTEVRAGKGAAFVEGRTVFDLAAAEPAKVELGADGVEQNQSVVVADMELRDGGVIGAEIAVSLSGTYSPFAKVTEKHPGGKVTGCVLGGLKGTAWKSDCKKCSAELLHLDPELAAFNYVVEGAAASEGRAIEVGLPWAPRSQLLGLDLHRQTRQTAMTLGSRGIESVKLTLPIPKGYELRSKLPAGKVENAVGSLVTVSRKEGETIVIERTLRIEQRIISATDYPALRALFVELTRSDQRALLFFHSRPEPAS